MTDRPLHIITLHGLQGAPQARGVAVVIDVLRAFSTACYLKAAGAATLLAVAEAEEAQRLKLNYPEAILMGERRGYRLAGFDLGNSPGQVLGRDWHDRTVILTTSNGTQGLAAARQAQQVLTGSFVNADAIVEYIRRRAATVVSLVCMGSEDRPAVEDLLCAQYLQEYLLGRTPDFAAMRSTIMQSPAAKKFLDGHSPDLPAEDLELCLELNRFDFVLRADHTPQGAIELKQIRA
ncbi:MAG: 2-phosphosulfolactate phosphatase [Desulfobacteraceae bacterium]|nr:2-phosphosulfolactate phosphatase [Desulfobacteraceae bacterium]